MNNAFDLVGVTKEDFKKWCKQNKKPIYKKEVKAEFFERIQKGRLVKDEKGSLIKKQKEDEDE